MAIRLPDPLTNPKAPGFVRAPIKNNDPQYRERLPGGKVYTVKGSAQYWGVTLSYEDLTKEQYNILISEYLLGINRGERFQVFIPHLQSYTAPSDTTGMIIPAGQKGDTLNITNYTSNQLPTIGDVFKLSNSTKVYKILRAEKVNTTLKLTIFPNLVRETVGTEKVQFNGVLFTLVPERPEEFSDTFTVDNYYSSFDLEFSEEIIND